MKDIFINFAMGSCGVLVGSFLGIVLIACISRILTDILNSFQKPKIKKENNEQ